VVDILRKEVASPAPAAMRGHFGTQIVFLVPVTRYDTSVAKVDAQFCATKHLFLLRCSLR